MIGHFGSLDALLERVEEVPFLRMRGALQIAEKLRKGRDDALLYRLLSTIARDATVPLSAADYACARPDTVALEATLDQLKFGPLTRRRCRDWHARFA